MSGLMFLQTLLNMTYIDQIRNYLTYLAVLLQKYSYSDGSIEDLRLHTVEILTLLVSLEVKISGKTLLTDIMQNTLKFYEHTLTTSNKQQLQEIS